LAAEHCSAANNNNIGIEFTARNETMNKKLLMNGLFAAGLMATMPLSFAQAQSMAISQMPIADIVARLESDLRQREPNQW
jgi:hypothetical protein